MASFTRSFFFFFFTILLSSTLLLSTQIHARESYSFGKFQRDKNPSFVPLEGNDQKTESVEELPKKDQDLGFVPESGKGYGLYGHETTYNNAENNNNEEFNKQYEEENVNYEPYNTPSLSETEESYNYDKYSKDNNNNNDDDKSYYNSNAYGGERSSSSSSSSSSSGFNGYNNKKNNVERQGMSDTRFMENGKYYFDINDENNHGDSYRKRYRHRTPSYAVSNYDRFGQNNNGGSSFYNDDNNNNYNNEEKSFQDPYNSKWENNNMMNEQEQEQEQVQDFGDEQQNQFTP